MPSGWVLKAEQGWLRTLWQRKWGARLRGSFQGEAELEDVSIP